MIIIGFIETDRNMKALRLFDEICIKNKLKLSKDIKSDADIISIKLRYEDFSSKKYKNIKFDVLIFENCGIMEEKIESSILDTISNKNILVVNSDDKKIFKLLKGTKSRLITYGLNNKACITISSMKNDEDSVIRIECCIQRIIPAFTANTLEPQEFKIILKKYKNNTIYDSLAAVSGAIICGIRTESLEKIIL